MTPLGKEGVVGSWAEDDLPVSLVPEDGIGAGRVEEVVLINSS